MNMACCNGGYHEFNLDGFLKRFKELLKEWDSAETEWSELERYVKNYFNNLDISKEVKENFDELVSSGKIYDMIGYNNFFAGKNLYFYGDSITYGVLASNGRAEKPFPDIIGDILKANVFNYAVSGATASNAVEPSNNFSSQIAQHPYNNADYIFVCFGTNDYSKSAYLGTKDDGESMDTFYGSMIKIIGDMLANNKKVIILTPPGGKYMYNNYSVLNEKGLLMYNYIHACEIISDMLRVPCINLTKTFMSYLNVFHYMGDSSAHYTEEGYRIIGEYIAFNLMQNNYYYGIEDGESPMCILEEKDIENVEEYVINQYSNGLRASINGNVKLSRQLSLNRPARYWVVFYANNLNTDNSILKIHIGEDIIKLKIPVGYSYQSVVYTPNTGGDVNVSIEGNNVQIFSFRICFRNIVPMTVHRPLKKLTAVGTQTIGHNNIIVNDDGSISLDITFTSVEGGYIRIEGFRGSGGTFVLGGNVGGNEIMRFTIAQDGTITTAAALNTGTTYFISGTYLIS